MLYSLGHHRSHGFALLVALLAFPAIAQWSGNDSYRLDQIYLQLGGDYNSSHTIHSDLTEILSFQRRDFNVATNTYRLLESFFDEFSSVLSPDLSGGYQAVKTDLVLDGYTPYVHRGLPYDDRTSAELLVTNRAETYWLEKISGQLDLLSGGGISMLTPWGYSLSWDAYDYWHDFQTRIEAGDFSNAILHSGLWGVFPMLMLDVIDYSLLPENDPALLSFLEYQLCMTPTSAKRFLRYMSSDGGIGPIYNQQYGNAPLLEFFKTTGLDTDNFNPTNFFTADGTIENTDNSFTNSSSLFNKFATSFLPSSLFDPEEVDTNLFEYVDADISPTPTFNPRPLQGGTRSRSSASFDYDFDDSEDYSYNLLNPLKTATDQVQNDTDIDNKFQTLADLVNQRISSIFDSPLNSISQQPSRWSVKFRDKDGNSLEEYVSSQQSETSDGITFVCWVIESTMFAGFFFTCVRRSLRIGSAGDPPT